jgi:pimeloyl-ACP methyl ester carboxylesterase
MSTITRRTLVRSGVTLLAADAFFGSVGARAQSNDVFPRVPAVAPLTGVRRGATQANGFSLATYQAGRGPAVLLIHGNPDSAAVWRHQIASLSAAGFRVIAYDLLGCGDSDIARGVAPYSWQHELAGAWAVVDAAGVEKLHAVIAHDRGAPVAWRMAAGRPERVNRLVAMSVGHPTSLSDPDIEQIEKFWYNFRFQFPDAEDFLRRDNWRVFRAWMRNHSETETWIRDLSRPGALESLMNFWRANTNPIADPPPAIPSVTIPVTGVWSSGDAYCNERQMVQSERHVAGKWQYVRIEDASHFMQLDQPQQVTKVLLDALG